MATWTNQTKNSATFTNIAKNSSSIENVNKMVRPWQYNQSAFIYNQVIDSQSQPVYYNSLGLTTWSNQSKS